MSLRVCCTKCQTAFLAPGDEPGTTIECPKCGAWHRLPADLHEAARHRSRFMSPWESVPVSLADGILDDETYDWWEVMKAMRETDGGSVVVQEDAVSRAHSLARVHTGIAASFTGTAGLAGVLTAPGHDETLAVVFSGAERTAAVTTAVRTGAKDETPRGC